MKKRDFHFREELLNKQVSYCLQEQCTKKGKCLHYLAYQHSQPFMTAIFRDPRNPQKDESCTDYLSNKVQRVGRGFRQALSQVRRGQGNAVKQEIMILLDCGRSQFYNYANGLKALTTTQELKMKNIFAKYDVNLEPLCDTYEDSYCL